MQGVSQGKPPEVAAKAGEASYALAGFLAMAFAVVGLTGLLAAHVGRLPLDRALAREVVLDEALAASRAGNAAALEALRPRLGDSAAAVLPAGTEFEARVAAERVAMRGRRMAEAEATGARLRVLLVVTTLLAGAFGVAVLLGARRVAAGGKVG